MDGGNGGTAVRVEEAAGAQGAAEPEAAAQVASGGDGSAASGTGVGAMVETGGDAAVKARAEYEKALAERDARIAGLEGEIAGAAAPKPKGVTGLPNAGGRRLTRGRS